MGDDTVAEKMKGHSTDWFKWMSSVSVGRELNRLHMTDRVRIRELINKW